LWVDLKRGEWRERPATEAWMWLQLFADGKEMLRLWVADQIPYGGDWDYKMQRRRLLHWIPAPPYRRGVLGRCDQGGFPSPSRCRLAVFDGEGAEAS
jgi:hypothetical protein